MAELPEAITISGQINSELAGKKILSVSVKNCDRLLKDSFVNMDPATFEQTLTDKTLSGACYRGKWIIVRMEPDCFLLLALEMGGKILYDSIDALNKEKYHLKLIFNDDSCMIVKIKGLGFMRLSDADHLDAWIYPGRLGLCPADKDRFTAESLSKIVAAFPRRNIKDILLDQRNIAGLANCYLNDILYLAKIHPKTKAGDLTDDQKKRLYKSIVEVVDRAVSEHGKSTDTDLFGKYGGYVFEMSDKTAHTPCPACGHTIQKISTSGSSSYICDGCQVL